MGDHSRQGLRIVDPRFVGTHSRLAACIRWLILADEMASNATPGPLSRILPDFSDMEPRQPRGLACLLREALQSLLFGLLFGVWCILVPGALRVAVYKRYQDSERLDMTIPALLQSSFCHLDYT